MFNNNAHFDTWNKLRKLSEARDIESFVKHLSDTLPALEESRDELRILFYIAMHCGHTLYQESVNLLASRAEVIRNPDQTRIQVFINAVDAALDYHPREELDYIKQVLLKAIPLKNSL